MKNFCEKGEYGVKKYLIMQKNVSNNGNMFKETKLSLYFRKENHGYVTKTYAT